jgi:hypothetical protein
MLGACGRINLFQSSKTHRHASENTQENSFPHDRYNQSGDTLFRPDLHRLRLRESQGVAGVRARLDELLPALRVAAGAAVRDHVANAVRRAQQSAIPDRDHARHHARLCDRHDRRQADRQTDAARGDDCGACRRLRQCRLYGPGAGAGRARQQGGSTDRTDATAFSCSRSCRS